ncbi:hypothetical protein M501DRAFT_238856 [Patellaria atrata CBS 101060]|uniref:Uncharacterized protein n=1 Tax=Patellaria atrata CBS 101060 TaxID=1346257 RepID=A0A9P4S5C1_9PEZI|nr:hypothetical protein M501DRAFT_238856 [Patellaria atrata CBS 101060]
MLSMGAFLPAADAWTGCGGEVLAVCAFSALYSIMIFGGEFSIISFVLWGWRKGLCLVLLCRRTLAYLTPKLQSLAFPNQVVDSRTMKISYHYSSLRSIFE